MKFFQELNESRMYRRLNQLEGKSIHDVAERLFEHLLALQIFANEDRGTAMKYANQIMRQQAFDGFRTSMPDLYNLIALVKKQSNYEHVIDTDETVGIPELRMRRNLREIGRGGFDNNDYSQMMLMLQRRFDELPNVLKELRRQISTWDRKSEGNKKVLIRKLMLQMRERGMQSDMFMDLQKLV